MPRRGARRRARRQTVGTATAWIVAVGAAVLAAAPPGCVESTSSRRGGPAGGGSEGPTQPSTGTVTPGFDKRALLQHLAEEVIVSTYADFVSAAVALEAAAVAHASTLDPGDHDALEQAWRDAMVVWQQAELFQLGPAGASNAVVGGLGLRDEIYSWPTVNRCRTDQKLVSGEYADPVAFANELISVRGLATLEYLLFHGGSGNACSADASINSQGTWAAIAEELPQRRADYAVTLAVLLRQRAQQLHGAWVAEGGNFVSELVRAGIGSTFYASDQAALNAVSDALFYLDTKTKDLKLAVPVGLAPDCASEVCPEALESTFAGFAKEELRANLVGFQRAFHGGARDDGAALGFDDWLVAAGAGALAQEMGDDIEAALAAVDAIEEADLADALVTDKASVEALYFAVKAVSDDLKSQFISVLDLELPKSAEGDND
jgi:predicted lipoprotein